MWLALRQGIVLVPFIDERRLLAAEGPVSATRLSDDERERNKLGELLIFAPGKGARPCLDERPLQPEFPLSCAVRCRLSCAVRCRQS